MQNAPVYVDANGDGELNPDDGDGVWEDGEDYLIGRTDAQGRYSGSVPDRLKNNIRIAHTSAEGVVHKNPDGTDAGALPEVLKAKASAPVISVLSHSVVQGYATEEHLKNQSPNGYDPFKHNVWIEGGVPAGVTPADIEKIKQFVKTFTSTVRSLEAKVGSLEERYAEMTKQLDSLIKRVFGTPEEAPEQSEPDPQEEVVDTPNPPPPKAPSVIGPPGFTSGAAGTDLMEHATGRDVEVYDADAAVGAGSSGTVSFSLKSGAPSFLSIDAGTGVVTLTGQIDLDARGEASRIVHFTVVATDSANPARKTEKTVSFTITNSDEQPAAMTVTPVASNASFSESANKAGGIELAQVRFQDNDKPAPSGQNNGATISAVSDTGHRLTTADFVFRDGGIYLKHTADTTVSADATVTVTVTPATSGHGTRPLPQNFTFTITNDVPPPNTRPTAVKLSRPSHQVNEGENVADIGALARIKIEDDGHGTVGLAALTPDSIFEYRAVEGARGVYDLYLKRTVTLDQSRIGPHEVSIRATGDGTGTDPDPVRFTLTVRHEERDPVLTITRPAGGQTPVSETVGDTQTTPRIDTGIRVLADDPDGNLLPLVIETLRPAGDGRLTYAADNRFELVDGKLFVRAGQTFDYENTDNPGGVIQFRVIARDSTQNEVTKSFTFQLTDADDPTIVNSLSIDGLVNGSARPGTALTARLDARDPDTQLDYLYAWLHEHDKEPLSTSRTFTPDQSGKHVLTILIHDRKFDSFKWVQREFTVPEPVTPKPAPPRPEPAPAPETVVPEQNIRFFSTDSGVFKNSVYLFSLPQDVEDYHTIGTVHYGDHADQKQSSGRTLYTLDGPHRHLLRLASDGVLRLGNNIDLDAEGLNGLAELHFTVAALYLPNAGTNGRMSYSRTDGRIVIFDPLNPDRNSDSASPAPPHIGIDGEQTVITELVGGNHTSAGLDTGIDIRVNDPNNDLNRIVIESLQGRRWQIDNRFAMTDGELIVKAEQTLDYEDADNPDGVITLRITATDDAGHSVRREVTLRLTDADEPSIGSVRIVTGSASPQTGQPLEAKFEASDENGIASQWVSWTRDGAPLFNKSLLFTGTGITPTEAGVWRAVLHVRDNDGNTQNFTSDPVTVTTPAPAPAKPDVTHSVHENHPLTKPIIDLDGVGVFAMAPVADAPDNQFFRVDAETGKIWFVPRDANGNGVKDPGDYPLLDADDHRDQGRDGTYDLRLTRTTPDGIETINLALTVDDLPIEYRAAQHLDRWHEFPEVYDFRFSQVEDAVERWIDEHRPSLSPEARKAEADYVKILLMGSAWAMPQQGPLIITWSFKLPESPYIGESYSNEPVNDARPESGQLYLTTQERVETYRAAFEWAMAKFESVANIKFVEVSETEETLAMMRITVQWQGGAFGTGSGSAGVSPFAAGFLKLQYNAPTSTYLHELIHALGVKHPFQASRDFPGNPDERDTLNSIAGYGPRESRTVTQNDINVLQFLYGAPGTNFDGLQSIIDDLDINLPPGHPYLDIA